MTLGGAIALIVFFAFAMQCTSTIAVVRRETNSWKWPALQFSYMLVLAYTAAFATNQIIYALLLTQIHRILRELRFLHRRICENL